MAQPTDIGDFIATMIGRACIELGLSNPFESPATQQSAQSMNQESFEPPMRETYAKTDVEPFSLIEIPFEADRRIGAIFREGTDKYGRGNWRKGAYNQNYQLERMNHALKHLKIYVHYLETGEYLGEIKAGKPEDDLAKVGWAVATQMELERLEQTSPKQDNRR